MDEVDFEERTTSGNPTTSKLRGLEAGRSNIAKEPGIDADPLSNSLLSDDVDIGNSSTDNSKIKKETKKIIIKEERKINKLSPAEGLEDIKLSGTCSTGTDSISMAGSIFNSPSRDDDDKFKGSTSDSENKKV